MIDLLENLSGGGNSLDLLLAHNGDPGILRPWVGRDGRSYVTLNQGGKLVTRLSNANATLPYDAWKFFDDTVLTALYHPLMAWKDLRMRGLEVRVPNGMGSTMLQYQKRGDTNAATVSMRPSRRGEADRPEIETATLPIPIVHKDFDFDLRELLAARNSAMPLDTTSITIAGQKIAEALENMVFGTYALSLQGTRIYGYTDLPERATKSDFTVPTGSNGGTTVNEVLALRQLLVNDKHNGPYKLYMNSQWAQYLDTDFSTAKGDNTLRQRLLAITGIQEVEVSQYLPSTYYAMVLVEMDSLTTRAVVAVDVTTVQWETLGGMMRHFKVFTAATPHVRGDQAGNAGVAHGTSATA